MAKFQSGQSGNPKGRPKGAGKVAALRDQIAEHVPALIDKLIEAAKAGDVAAARLLLERVLPPVKAEDRPVRFDLPNGTPVEQIDAVLRAVSSGAIPASVGQAVVAMIRAKLAPRGTGAADDEMPVLIDPDPDV